MTPKAVVDVVTPTNGSNQAAYLNNLAKTGTPGEQAWANDQLGISNNIPSTLNDGVIDTSVAGYDPADYSAASSSGSTISGSTIFGYLIVSLVGVVILDRLMK